MDWFHDKKHDVLLYPARYMPEAYLPEARYVGDQFFGVKRTLRSCQILRHLNFPVPPIITDDNYDWPIQPGRKPLAHQKAFF